ncbi:MAG: OsmC family protein [SAR86 cluster bacterium]|jgi:peroxiredoxin-like protein|tara:strand:- start:2502 stop:2963 length:462 start_codon:yes stop_codon:yes gene_type:complete
MQDFPHIYHVTATADSLENLSLTSAGLPVITSAAPKEFGGPGDKWSPETLLIAAVADCFVLTFRAIASASKLPWLTLTCAVEGCLDRQDGVTRFTAFDIVVVLEVPQDTNEGRALRLLEKAEKNCLITNSLVAPVKLQASIIINRDAESGQAS